MFVLIFEENVEKDLSFLNNKQKDFIRQKIQILKTNPFPVGKNPKRLQGINAYRMRAGYYRVMYRIAGNEVRIFSIKHRKDAYRS